MIAQVAARQRGLVTRAQLFEAGLSSSAIGRWAGSGRLNAVLHGVYAVGHPALPPLGLMEAALLACGSDSVLSHHSAAIVSRLLPLDGSPVHVTLPQRHGSLRGVRLHRTTVLPRSEIRIREGLRITAPVRTLIDLAAADPAAFDRALNEALVMRLLTRTELDAGLVSGRPGAARLRKALDAGPRPTRSKLERRLLALVAAADLPPPRTNTRVGRHEVDALWAGHRLVVEVDGYGAHSTRRAFEADRIRDAELAAAGYRVLRITWRRLEQRPHAVAAVLACALAR